MGCSSSVPVAHHHSDPQPKPKEHHHHKDKHQHSPPQQQQQQQQQYQPPPPQAAVTPFQLAPQRPLAKVEVNGQLIERYAAIERQINALERQNVVKNHEQVFRDIQQLEAKMRETRERYARCQAETRKEQQDVVKLQDPSVRNFFGDQAAFEQQFSKEQEEYLAALNREEMVKKELDSLDLQRQQRMRETTSLRSSIDELNQLCSEQDHILKAVFEGSYGSELEYTLEIKCDDLADRVERIRAAKDKWANAYSMLETANSQFAYAVQRWSELRNMPGSNPNGRYQMAVETRNYLCAALQNVEGAQRILNGIKFPYCAPDEMQTLRKAVEYIFCDMNTPPRHAHAFDCYSALYKRCHALVQWVKCVIDDTIKKDHDKAETEFKAIQRQLREERMKLIHDKIHQVTGEQVDMKDYGEDDHQEEIKHEHSIVQPDVISAADMPGDKKEMPDVPPPPQPVAAPPPPQEQLAPPPSMEDLIGDVKEIQKRHEKDMEELRKTQENSRARADASLEAQLRERRSRQARLRVHEEQMQQMESVQ